MTQPPPNAMLEYASSPQGIREIARRQRAIILCILAYLILYVALLAGQNAIPPEIRLVAVLGIVVAMLAVEVTAAVFVFMLTIKLYGTGIGILLGILTLIPCIGLITLLIVNARATAILRKNGIKVGLLGANVP